MKRGKIPITENKLADLIAHGERINALVTPQVVDGVLCVNIRDCQFNDMVQAAMYLRQIEMTEIPDSTCYLIA